MPRRLRVKFAGQYRLTPVAGAFVVSGKPSTGTPGSTNVAAYIITQPVAQSVIAPNAATFSVFAGGTAPLTYQWYRDGAAISGATSASYTLSTTATSDTGATFYCVVDNAYGDPVTSNTVALTVSPVAPFLIVRTNTSYAALRLAVAAAQSGDTIRVAGGSYTVVNPDDPGDPRCTINLNALTIEAESLSNPPIIDASARLLANLQAGGNGHAIEMGASCLNLTVRGLRIKGQRGFAPEYPSAINAFPGYPTNTATASLTVEYCKFETFANGIKTQDNPNATLTCNYTSFLDCGDTSQSGQMHGVYIGAWGAGAFLGCSFRFTSFFSGHMFKSRAKTTSIRGSKLDDGGFGYGSRAADISNGGQFTFTGNIVLHSAYNQVFGFGLEQVSAGSGLYRNDGRTHSITIAQNTVRKSQVSTASVEPVIRIGTVVNGDGSAATITTSDANGSTLRNNIVGSNDSSAATFVATHANNTAVVHTTIADSGVYSGGAVSGSPAVNDAAYAYAAELEAPTARTDTNRGGLSGAPSYISSMSAYDVRQMSDSYAPTNGFGTILSVTPAEWVSGDPGVVDLPGVVNAWSGGFKGSGTVLYVHGGGHEDSANNGIYAFDFSGTAAPTGWSVAGQSAVSAVIDATTYGDGRPAAVHTYDGSIRVGAKLYRFGGSRYRSGGFTGTCWAFNNSWASLPNLPSGVGTEVPHTVYDAVSNKILYLPSASGTGAFFRCDTDTWGAARANPTEIGYYACPAYDTTRGRIVVLGRSYGGTPLYKIITPNWSAETVSGASFTPSGDTAILSAPALSMFYDAARDCFWIWGGTSSNTAGYTNIYEMNASTFAVTAHPLSQSMASFNATNNGSYGRWVFLSDWRAIGFVTSTSVAPFVIKLPG